MANAKLDYLAAGLVVAALGTAVGLGAMNRIAVEPGASASSLSEPSAMPGSSPDAPACEVPRAFSDWVAADQSGMCPYVSPFADFGP